MRAGWVLLAVAMALVPTADPPAPAAPRPEPAPTTAPPAWRSPPPEGYAAHAEDVADYTLTAKLDTVRHTVHGEGTIRWRNTSEKPVTELWLHLYLNAFKNERSVFMREAVGGFRGAFPVREWGAIDVTKLVWNDPSSGPTDLWKTAEREHDGDETDARVPLPREVAPGESIELGVAWDDKLPSIVERTGFERSFHMVGQWFPKIARLEPTGRWAHFPMHRLAEFYADFGTYDVTLDVPSSFTLGATGAIVESHTDAGRRIERHVQSDVHDFAFVAYDRFDEMRETVDGVVVVVLFPKGARRDALRELATIRFALPHYQALYGPYPYKVLTVVHPPDDAEEAGGMEYPTLITTGGDWYRPPFARLLELVTIHEFGHQYFYGLLASDEVSWPFLDEGVNSYAESEALGSWLGAGSAASIFGLSLSDTAVQAVFGNEREHDEPVAQSAFGFRSGYDYGRLVYERTAGILATLRRVYGASAVRAMSRYARVYRFKHPVPEDLIGCFETEAGAPVAATLRTALFEKGWVDYAITGIASKRVEAPGGIFDEGDKRQTRAAGQWVGTSYEGWVLVTRRGTLSFPVDVELTLDDGTTQRVRWNGEDESVRLPYRGPVGLRAAVVDPDHTVLLDDDLTNNHASMATSHHAVRASERLAYWAELLLSAIGP